MVNEIHNVISTLFQRWKSYILPICIFNLFSTLIQRRKGIFQRRLDVETTPFCTQGSRLACGHKARRSDATASL